MVSAPRSAELYTETWRLPPSPLGVNAGALAACVEKVGFLPADCRFAGVKEGDSTFRALRDLGRRVSTAYAWILSTQAHRGRRKADSVCGIGDLTYMSGGFELFLF